MAGGSSPETSTRGGGQKAGRPMQVAVMLVLVLLVNFSLGEAVWWATSKASYPAFLVGHPPAGVHDLTALYKACGTPIEVAPGRPGRAIVRCGSFWPMRSMWDVDARSVEPALGEQGGQPSR